MTIKEKKPPMHAEVPSASLLARRPLSAFGKLAVAALLGAALTSGILAITIGFPTNTALLIVTLSLLGGAGLAATRFRWMPLLMTLLNGLFLYQLLRAPFVLYHLSSPRGHEFFPFVIDVLIIAFALVACGASLSATIQTYRQGKGHVPGLPPAILTGLVTGVAGIFLGSILIAAIAQPRTMPARTTLTNGVPTVHMSAANFTPSSITIAKGSKLLLVDDVPVLHLLANGSWQHGTARPAREPGAPNVSNVQVNNNSVEIGPFTTAGTYHLYCTIHVGMNLTIIVH